MRVWPGEPWLRTAVFLSSCYICFKCVSCFFLSNSPVHLYFMLKYPSLCLFHQPVIRRVSAPPSPATAEVLVCLSICWFFTHPSFVSSFLSLHVLRTVRQCCPSLPEHYAALKVLYASSFVFPCPPSRYYSVSLPFRTCVCQAVILPVFSSLACLS